MRVKAYLYVFFLFLALPCSNAATDIEAVPEALPSVIIKTADDCQKFFVEIANSTELRQRGLMYRNTLPANQGMLFVYEQPRVVSMWMKNTRIPLDILFIDSDGLIVNMVKNATPMSERSMSSNYRVQFVLELNAGVIQQYDIRHGDKVIF